MVNDVQRATACRKERGSSECAFFYHGQLLGSRIGGDGGTCVLKHSHAQHVTSCGRHITCINQGMHAAGALSHPVTPGRRLRTSQS